MKHIFNIPILNFDYLLYIFVINIAIYIICLDGELIWGICQIFHLSSYEDAKVNYEKYLWKFCVVLYCSLFAHMAKSFYESSKYLYDIVQMRHEYVYVIPSIFIRKWSFFLICILFSMFTLSFTVCLFLNVKNRRFLADQEILLQYLYILILKSDWKINLAQNIIHAWLNAFVISIAYK